PRPVVPRPRRHPHPRLGGHRGEPGELVLVRGQLRLLRGEQGRPTGARRRAPQPHELPQAHARLMARLTVPVKLRWSDIDGYGHVNNAAMLTLLEEARIAAFWASPEDPDVAGGRILAAGDGAQTATFIAHQEIEY